MQEPRSKEQSQSRTFRPLMLSLNLVCRLVIGIIFVISAVDKVGHPLSFYDILAHYHLWNWLMDTIVTVLPAFEMLVGIFLVLGLATRLATLSAAVMLTVYTCVLLFSLATGNTDHGCGCFLSTESGNGAIQFLTGGKTITDSEFIRDLFFVAIALTCYFTYFPKMGLDAVWFAFHAREESKRRELNSHLQRGKIAHKNRVKPEGVARPAGYLKIADWINTRFYFLLSVFGILAFCVALGLVAKVNLGIQEYQPLINASDFHPGSRIPIVGEMAPSFNLKTLGGTRYSLKEYRGKVVLLELFALWCPRCQAEVPILQEVDNMFLHSQFQTLSVIASPYSKYYDQSGGRDTSPYTSKDVAWFEHTFHVTNPVLIDPKFTVSNLYLSTGYPTIYVIDKAGRIRAMFSGTTSELKIVDTIQTINS